MDLPGKHVGDYKFVAVINQDIGHTGLALNAIAHLAAGLVGSASPALQKKMSFIDFTDKNGGTHPSISALAFDRTQREKR